MINECLPCLPVLKLVVKLKTLTRENQKFSSVLWDSWTLCQVWNIAFSKHESRNMNCFIQNVFNRNVSLPAGKWKSLKFNSPNISDDKANRKTDYLNSTIRKKCAIVSFQQFRKSIRGLRWCSVSSHIANIFNISSTFSSNSLKPYKLHSRCSHVSFSQVS